MDPREPTADECTANAEIAPGQFACWYPQMGGYSGKCVVWISTPGCFDAYVWHDGSFPFDSEDRDPAHIHHCSPEQFITFGNFVRKLQRPRIGWPSDNSA